MRIVDLTTFLAMPAGTIFMKYEPVDFGPLCCKEENSGEIGFYYAELGPGIDADDDGEMFRMLDGAVANGNSVAIDVETVTRDGLYDTTQLYAVLERQDLEKLVAVFTEALSL